MPLPLLGNMHSIAFNPPGYDVFKKWAQQYGPIHTFWMGEDPVVEITDYDLIIETFQKDGETYAGREDNSTMRELTHGRKAEKKNRRVHRSPVENFYFYNVFHREI